MDQAAVIDVIYRAAANHGFWSQALSTIVDYVGATAGNMVYQSPNGRGSFLIPGRMRDDLNAIYLEQYSRNPYARAFETVQPGRIAVGNAMIDAAAVRQSSFYADICAPQNIYNQLFLPHSSLHERGGIGGVALFLSAAQDARVTDAVRRLKGIAPHLMRAIDLSLQTQRLSPGPALPQRLVDAMPDATVLIGAQGEVLLLNAAAEALLERADGLSTCLSDRLSLVGSDARTSGSLTQAIRKALVVAQGGATIFDGVLLISRPSGLAPYIVMVTPLAPAAFSVWDAADSGARVLVTIVDPDAKAGSQTRNLQRLFGLTDAETRVAALIGSGFNLPEIGQMLNISTNTAKTHASRCFSKAGVRSQAGLARLIAAIPIAPRSRSG
jgi:DNA-binding CsgD family transcriptional regulator